MSLFEINNVRKSFGDLTVLHDISVKVDEGEVVAIIGPSGSGKSTLLRCATMLETMDSGELIYLDEKAAHNDPAGHTAYASPADLRRIKGYFGLVFQNFNLFPHFSVMRNLTEAPIHVQKRERGEVEKEARELIRKMGLEGKENYYPQQLSGGQQQRVAIARTLAPEPSVLFMDEPLSNLDAKLRLEMRSELQRLHLETGSTFVYVTHDQMEAMTLATKICLIDNGVLQQYEAPLTVYDTPSNLFVADFVGNPAINFIDAKGKQNEDGSFSFTIFDDKKVTFHPRKKFDIGEWYESVAEDEARLQEVKAEAAAKKGYVEKGNKDTVFKYHIAQIDEKEDYGDEVVLTEEDFVLGVRPEQIHITNEGGLHGEIYSSMPTGMETTVRVAVGNYILTGVMFGGVVYKIGDMTDVEFKGKNVILFSRKNGRFISLGSLTID